MLVFLFVTLQRLH